METIQVSTDEKRIIDLLRDKKNQQEYSHYIRAAYNNYASLSLGSFPNDIGAIAYIIMEFDNILTSFNVQGTNEK